MANSMGIANASLDTTTGPLTEGLKTNQGHHGEQPEDDERVEGPAGEEEQDQQGERDNCSCVKLLPYSV